MQAPSHAQGVRGTLSQREGHLFLIVIETLTFVLCNAGRPVLVGTGLKLLSRMKGDGEEREGGREVLGSEDLALEVTPWRRKSPWRSEESRPGQRRTSRPGGKIPENSRGSEAALVLDNGVTFTRNLVSREVKTEPDSRVQEGGRGRKGRKCESQGRQGEKPGPNVQKMA